MTLTPILTVICTALCAAVFAAEYFCVQALLRQKSGQALVFWRRADVPGGLAFGGVGAVLAYFGVLGQKNPPAALCTLLFLLALQAVAVYDERTMEIPDGLCVFCAAVGLVSYFIRGDLPWYSPLLGAVCVSVPLCCIALLVPGAFGGGDIKLMAACGIFLGWKLCLLAAFIAVLLAGAWGVWLLLRKRAGRKDQFAFGPFLCAAMALCVCRGGELLTLFVKAFDFSGYF